ncbi:sigma 54 modulation/S30EA ribosomal C-terminal domain-containing protein [Nocardia sp. NBC_01503]|uniref:sigma 54 modulation/S30EA ribosomal C-terminal domain-containing protein n=1 Tax=Nocardia sp. NBC_01503 TaxID=2975997 RepID=UPI002E7AFE36|nr:sigma 54 modulation/S30EA ribosomal C-terminal domain-containing protein [Nocardia sp. NBC_01503]WTL32062.1 sigma 54 modulation/S30EA ribosomal C-terminal domain-containing protein [Nocardia sp. NBC_01503]
MRRKTVALRTAEPLTAAAVMDAMDYDAHLFTDAETAEDSILYRARQTGLRLARQRCVQPPRSALASAATPIPLITTPRPAPVLTEHNAADRVCEFGLPFLFYTDFDTGRGHLMYRRYDADLGLITPASSAAACS